MWNLSLVIWCYAKVLIMKTDITKGFRCQQVFLWENSAKQSMDCSLWSWVISRWTLTLSRKSRMMMCWSKFENYITDCTPTSSDKHSRGVILWHVTIYVKNCHTCKQCSKKRKNIVPGRCVESARWMCGIYQSICVQELLSEFLHPCSWIVNLSRCYFLVIYQFFLVHADKPHVLIFIFLYIRDVIYHCIYKLLNSIIWIAISIHSNV